MHLVGESSDTAMSAQGWQGSGFCRDATHVSPATAVPRALSPVSFETYIIPCVAWSWFYRTQERRDHAVIKPPRCGGRGLCMQQLCPIR